jgi:pyridoxal phosphate enzyme (YggS family)
MEPLPATRLAAIRARIQAAAERVGRDPAGIRLVGASKTVEAERLTGFVEQGLVDLGENRVQEAEAKIQRVTGATWHLIGHLQSNKARKAVALFDWIHSVDSPSLADSLERIAQELGRRPRVLVEVNTSGEASKHGVAPLDARELVAYLGGLPHLSVEGLMTIGPLEGDPRPAFRMLRAIGEETGVAELSMGMSGDFEIAIEEGATMVRVGSALFGARA